MFAAVEAARRALQRELDRNKTAQQRNRVGQFATPPELALEIAHWIAAQWRDRGLLRMLEPALGTGAFYGALLSAFGAERIERALGIERDPDFARAARALWTSAGLRVRCKDFLACAPPAAGARFNLLLTNPPYVRHHHVSAPEKARLRRSPWARERDVSGLASLYVHFVLAADAWLEEGGLAVWLIPSECLDVNYGAALRAYLAHDVALLQVHRFDPQERKFGDALVTSAVIAYEKRRVDTHPCHTARFSAGGSLARPRTCIELDVAHIRGEPRWSRLARAHRTSRSRGALPIGAVFDVRRGIATGANAFFISSLAQAIERGIPACALRPILPSPRRIRETVIHARADGYPDLEDPLVVLDCTLSEEEIRERWPSLWLYLEQGRAQGLHLRYLARHRSPWYAQERREPAPFLCTYMGRATSGRGDRPFRFLSNRSQAIAPNVYLMMFPKGRLREALARDPALLSVVHELLEAIDAEALLREGRTYGGGLHKIEPRELVALPVAGLDRVLSTC